MKKEKENQSGEKRHIGKGRVSRRTTHKRRRGGDSSQTTRLMERKGRAEVQDFGKGRCAGEK